MILVDSDVLIAHLRGVDAARQWLLQARRRSGRLATSVVCLAEVAGGMRSGERRSVARLLSTLHTFPVTERVAWHAADLMRTHRSSNVGIGLGDYLVAADNLSSGGASSFSGTNRAFGGCPHPRAGPGETGRPTPFFKQVGGPPPPQTA